MREEATASCQPGGGAGPGEGTRGGVASSSAPRGTGEWPGSAAPPPPPANEWPGPAKCYVARLPDTPSSDVALLFPRVVWRHFLEAPLSPKPLVEFTKSELRWTLLSLQKDLLLGGEGLCLLCRDRIKRPLARSYQVAREC